jgi:hypothetical protein
MTHDFSGCSVGEHHIEDLITKQRKISNHGTETSNKLTANHGIQDKTHYSNGLLDNNFQIEEYYGLFGLFGSVTVTLIPYLK